MSNRKAILLLLLGCVLLVAAHVFLSFHGVGGALVQRTSLAGELPFSAQAITIVRADGSETVLSRDDGWIIEKPYSARADERRVLELVDALSSSRIKHSFSRQDLEQFDRSFDDYGLGASAVKVSVSNEIETVTVLLGMATPTGDGVFARVEGDSSVYIVDGNVLAAADMPADGFRERALCPAGIELVDAFDLKRGKGMFLRFARRDGIWYRSSSKDGEDESPASAVKVRELLQGLSSATAIDFAWPTGSSGEPALPTATLLAGYGLDSESAVTLTLHSRGRRDVQIAFGKDASDGLVYALVQNARAVATVDGRLKDIAGSADFSDMRLFPYEPSMISRISVVDDGVNYLLAKGDDGKWRMDAPVSVDADEPSVAAFVTKLLSLTYDDRADDGLVLSLVTNAATEVVSRSAALSGLQLSDLRSRDMLVFDPSEVRRLAVTSRSSAKPTAVVFDRDRRTWIVESSERAGTVEQGSVDGILLALNPLRAEKVVKLKVSPSDLRRYGLETPRITLAVDSSKDGALRRNILIGERSQGGCFATLGASDAVFVLSEETTKRLTAPLVTE